MKKILALNGSPRPTGNTSHLLGKFLEGAALNSSRIESIYTKDLNIHSCNGCLRCNLLKKCSIRDDDWEILSSKILDSDVLVFASPVYFHHVSAPLKNIIDRFRSFVHVQITDTGLKHTPWVEWDKDLVVILSMGSPDPAEAEAILELFGFMKRIMGPKNRLHIISATRLAVIKQVSMEKEALLKLYTKLGLSSELVEEDFTRNQKLLKDCYRLGQTLSG